MTKALRKDTRFKKGNPALVALLVSGSVLADEDADGVLLTCSGNYNEGLHAGY